MKVFVIIMILLAGTEVFAQNNQVYSDQAGQLILLGPGDRSGMETPPFDAWFFPEYEMYHPDSSVIPLLKKETEKHLQVKIIMGTWCSDSRREVPRFYKILDALGFDEQNVKLYFVERDKTCPDLDTEALHIERVPTFIFYRNGKELGRIVETPEESLEKDMYHIIKL